MLISSWNERYSLGFAKLDSHHQQLFSRFNITPEDFIAKASATDLKSLLDQLVEYGIYQNYAEEMWMQKNRFPGLDKHRVVHERISRRILAIQKEVREENGPLSLEILSALHLLLKCHIDSSDEKITAFIVAREKQLHANGRHNKSNMAALVGVL